MEQLTEITVNVNTEKLQEQLNDLDLSEISDLEAYIRERIQVQSSEGILYVSLKEDDLE